MMGLVLYFRSAGFGSPLVSELCSAVAFTCAYILSVLTYLSALCATLSACFRSMCVLITIVVPKLISLFSFNCSMSLFDMW
jgi:hypothetical protein